jgi:hypothetical protein
MAAAATVGCSADKGISVLTIEWWPAAEQDVEDDSTAPDVSSLAVLTPQHLTGTARTSAGMRTLLISTPANKL